MGSNPAWGIFERIFFFLNIVAIGVSRLLKLLRWFLKIKNWNIWWLLVLYLLSDDATYFNHFKEGRKEWMSGRSVGPSGVLAGVLFGGTAVCVVQRSVQVYSMPMAILSESGFSAAPHIGCVPPPCCWLLSGQTTCLIHSLPTSSEIRHHAGDRTGMALEFGHLICNFWIQPTKCKNVIYTLYLYIDYYMTTGADWYG